ncbi:ribosome silencing factor [Candidatus Poriferisocius sp.]|uniref:ribosome silencing factor n=1 Tax=Candidatus Poriferisocius sp. TaxID=3101276 RepID=UPI003B5A1C02
MSVSTADKAVVWDWVKAAAAAAEEGPGADTVIIDVGDVLVITDHFVITSGANTRAVRALAERIEEAVDLGGGPKPICIEGLSDYEWVLMDYGDFVVHIFTASARDYYALELLWKDCPTLTANPLPS